MGLSSTFVEAHILDWEKRLKSPSYPHRVHWPKHLFHHAPLENALKIMRSGTLLSRDDSAGLRAADVAGAGVIHNSVRAHRFARLYFRPRTPTQYNIEGIRKAAECQRYGENAHAPILIMFVFEARQVLQTPGVHFSAGNMQAGAIEQSTEEAFAAIPFDKVYHEGGIGSDRSIIYHRCAEVLVPSPMPLEKNLRWIYCRSEAERLTLLAALANDALAWDRRVRVSDDLKVFEKRFAYVENVSLANGGVIFRINQRYDVQPSAIRLRAWDTNCRKWVDFVHVALKANANSWRYPANLAPGQYRIRIEIEDHLAFDALLWLGNLPF